MHTKFRLVLLFAFFANFGKPARTQNSRFIAFETDPIKDSLTIISIRDSLNIEYEDDPNSGFTEGNTYYSPDNLLRILVLKGEGCGAYCSPIYYSEIQYQTTKGIQKNFEELGDISQIYILKSNKESLNYLILDYASCRPRGIETGTQRGFLQIQLSDSLHFVPIVMYDGKESNYFSIYTGVLCNENPPKGKEALDFPVLETNPKSFIIQYEALEYEDENGKCFNRTGKFEWKKDHFIQTFDSRK